MESVDEYSIKDVVITLDIPRERLKEWINKGFVKGSIERLQGRRTITNYTRLDIYSIALFKYLIERLRFPREEAAKFVTLYLKSAKQKRKLFFYDYLIFQQLEDGLKYTSHLNFSMPSIIEASDEEARINLYGKMLRAPIESPGMETVFIINFRKIQDKVDQALNQ